MQKNNVFGSKTPFLIHFKPENSLKQCFLNYSEGLKQ